jgi:hypothetical protein
LIIAVPQPVVGRPTFAQSVLSLQGVVGQTAKLSREAAPAWADRCAAAMKNGGREIPTAV